MIVLFNFRHVQYHFFSLGFFYGGKGVGLFFERVCVCVRFSVCVHACVSLGEVLEKGEG